MAAAQVNLAHGITFATIETLSSPLFEISGRDLDCLLSMYAWMPYGLSSVRNTPVLLDIGLCQEWVSTLESLSEVFPEGLSKIGTRFL